MVQVVNPPRAPACLETHRQAVIVVTHGRVCPPLSVVLTDGDGSEFSVLFLTIIELSSVEGPL